MALYQRISYVIPAGGLLANALSGQGVEFIGRASLISVGGVADVAGDTIALNYTVGGDSKILIPAGSALNGAAAAGQGPKRDEDELIADYPVPAGAHLVLPVTGTAAHTGRLGFGINP